MPNPGSVIVGFVCSSLACVGVPVLALMMCWILRFACKSSIMDVSFEYIEY